MRFKFLPIVLAAQLLACSGDDDSKATNATNNTNNTNNATFDCGDGDAIELGDDLACVYGSELIEEGFSCPATVPEAFLTEDGGVVCVEAAVMPEPIAEELEARGILPAEPGCFGPNPAPKCYLGGEEEPGSAFDLTDASVFAYVTGGGFGYCVSEDDILDVEIDLTTGTATFGIGVAGNADTDECVTQLDGCLVREEASRELSQTELDGLVDLLEAIPAPVCTEETGRVCDECLIETFSVDDASITGVCCGEFNAGYVEALQAVVTYLDGLKPEIMVESKAFTNGDTFSTFTFRTGGGLGYCLEEGDIVGATITRNESDGSLAFQGTEALVGDEQTDTCIDGTINANVCLVETAFGPMTLTAQDQTDLEALLVALPAPMCVEDTGVACDPCLITYFDLDGTEVDNFCCGTHAEGYDAGFAAIVTLLEGLK